MNNPTFDLKFTVYDLETLSNCFTGVFKNHQTDAKKEFVIHHSRNDLRKLVKFLRGLKREEYYLVGFNCNQFDGQIINYILNHYDEFKRMDGEEIARRIYDVAQMIINLPDDEKFQQLIPEWNLKIPHIDVYKQCHFDGAQKRCSLKWLEFTMRFPNIETMPIHHSSYIDEEAVVKVLAYNGNDVDATDHFFKLMKFETELRFQLSVEYNLSLLNASEPKMARDIFGKFLSDQMGIRYRDLKEMRTYRNVLHGKDLIFPYVKFKDPILQGVKDFFTKLRFNPYDFEENNLGVKNVEVVFPFHNIPEVVAALGGVHGCIQPGVYDSSPDWIIHDIDATSYYPCLGIENNLFPEHLSELFCRVYKTLFEMRQEIPKENPINYVYKIILNSAYGLSMEMNNYFHDPKYTFSITINGQLLMLMFAQILRDKIKDIRFYQLNTDGVTIGYPPQYAKEVKWCMEQWTKLTRINLEDKFYKKMVIVDVNNYIAVDDKGKVKRKGLFGHSMKPEDKEVMYHKNPSALIIPKALEQYFVYGVPYEDYIKNHTDIFDFCCGVKIKRDFNLLKFSFNKETREIEKEIIDQTVARYYISNEASSLKKQYKEHSKTPGRIVELKKKWTMTFYNIHEAKKDIHDYDIDYRYYIQGVRDVISQIQPNQSQLKLEF